MQTTLDCSEIVSLIIFFTNMAKICKIMYRSITKILILSASRTQMTLANQ